MNRRHTVLAHAGFAGCAPDAERGERFLRHDLLDAESRVIHMNRDVLLWNAPRLPARQLTHGEPLWVLRRDGMTWDAGLRFHGEPYGWEAQLFRQGEFAIGRRFDTRALAIQWAEQECAGLERLAASRPR